MYKRFTDRVQSHVPCSRLCTCVSTHRGRENHEGTITSSVSRCVLSCLRLSLSVQSVPHVRHGTSFIRTLHYPETLAPVTCLRPIRPDPSRDSTHCRLDSRFFLWSGGYPSRPFSDSDLSEANSTPTPPRFGVSISPSCSPCPLLTLLRYVRYLSEHRVPAQTLSLVTSRVRRSIVVRDEYQQ